MLGRRTRPRSSENRSARDDSADASTAARGGGAACSEVGDGEIGGVTDGGAGSGSVFDLLQKDTRRCLASRAQAFEIHPETDPKIQMQIEAQISQQIRAESHSEIHSANAGIGAAAPWEAMDLADAPRGSNLCASEIHCGHRISPAHRLLIFMT